MEAEHLQDGQRAQKDFFINYAPSDTNWAEWIAWYLEQQHYSVTLAKWDFLPGSNSILELNKAVTDTERTIAILSPHYINALRTLPDWTVAFKRGASGEQKSLIPVKVKPCEIEGLFSTIELIDLVGKDEATALDHLLQRIKGIRAKPSVAPKFPGSKPQIVGIQLKNNPIFAGRERTLASIHIALHTGSVVSLTHTLTASKKSIGKTEVAKEYLYRYQSDYRSVLWVQDNPLDPSLTPFFRSIRSIAHELDLPAKSASDDMEILFALNGWLNNHTDWFLILDGVKDLQTVETLLPIQRKGHVLLTTRERATASIAQLIELDDLTDEEEAFSEKLAQLIDVALHSPNGQQFHLGPGDTTIGHATDNMIVLNDPSIAPYHAMITLKDSVYYLIDLKSSYGTFVNGQRLTPEIPSPLQREDSIQIGRVLFAYAPDARQLTFPATIADTNQSQKSSQEPFLPKITDPQAALQQARLGSSHNTWRVWQSEKDSFENFRQLATQLDIAFNRALILLLFLTITAIPLAFALTIEDTAIMVFIVLPTFCLNILAIVIFVVTMIAAINRTPGIVMDPPYPEALLVLTPDGFIEYIDKMHPTDVVSFADLLSIQIQRDDTNNILLLLSYFHGEGQWSQRAHFGPQEHIAQEIMEAFIYYQKQHGKTAQP